MKQVINHNKGGGLLNMIRRTDPGIFSACRSGIKHDHFWTETWANYLSKEYFGVNWLGAKYGYVVQPLNSFNKSIIELAKMPFIWSPISPFSH